MTTPALDLDAVEALCAAATPGPWSLRPVRFDDWGVIRSPWGTIVAVGRAGETEYDEREHRRLGTDPYEHNAAFIAAARTLVPQLVARVRALEAGPDDAACDRVIDALDEYARDYERHGNREEMRAAIRAALKGE